MGLQEFGHECDRFIAKGLPCPFRKSRQDDDDDEGEEKQPFPLVFPARRKADQEQQLKNVTTLAVAPKELREALERMAAFQNVGELQSIPNFPLSDRGQPEILSVLAAIALMKAFRALRARGLGTGLNAVRVGERHVTKGLAQVAQRPLLGGRGGGLHVNASADLRRLLFGRRRLRLGGQQVGQDNFSETGFQ